MGTALVSRSLAAQFKDWSLRQVRELASPFRVTIEAVRLVQLPM